MEPPLMDPLKVDNLSTMDRQLVTDLAAIYTLERTSESGQPLYNGQKWCALNLSIVERLSTVFLFSHRFDLF